MSNACFVSILVLFVYASKIATILAAEPDLVVRITSGLGTPPPLSGAKHLENDDGFLELLTKRAQFGSRDEFLRGTLVRSPVYDPFLCDRFYFTIEMDENGKLEAVTLPPYDLPGEDTPTVMLVPRGECSFERKAYAAKRYYGAKGIIIYDRLGARYRWNENSNQLIFPQDKLDYECNNGRSMMNHLPLDPPAYNPAQLDHLMGMTVSTTPGSQEEISVATNAKGVDNYRGDEHNFEDFSACDLIDNALDSCESRLCLVVSHQQNSSEFPVCCAWDTPVTMSPSEDAKDFDTDDILAVWLTIRQSETLLNSRFLELDNQITIESRGSKSAFNISYIFMWIWGTFVMAIGSWYAAEDYRAFGAKFTKYKVSQEGLEMAQQERRNMISSISPDQDSDQLFESKERQTEEHSSVCHRVTHDPEVESGKFYEDDVVLHFLSTGEDKSSENEPKKKRRKKLRKKKEHEEQVWSLHSLPPSRRERKKETNERATNRDDQRSTFQQERAERVDHGGVTIPERGAGRISSFEMTPYHVAGFIVVASVTLILLYFFQIAYTFVFILYGIGCAGAVSYIIVTPLVEKTISKLGKRSVKKFGRAILGGINGVGIASHVIAYTWAGVWIWYGMTEYQPQTKPFFWVSLNIFGACFCIMGAMVLKLNSIKIATILLVAIFLYDIFFVFITPFLTGGDSIMLHVATGSSNPGGQDFCYKYPNDRTCRGVGFLPMLFIFPQVNDYANGSVILGLGDVVLPGFLIAFSSRHDEASRLIRAHSPSITISDPVTWYNGFYLPMMLAYSLGLFFAFLAVILMEQGQPALLYICPICLASILILGRKDVKDLWNGAKVFRLADRLITKTERRWGEARMKRFAAKRRQENGAALPGSETRNNHTSNEPENHPEKIPSHVVRPGSTDVCFGRENHPGTRAFRKVIESVAYDLGEEEYKPPIYQLIRKKLKGRRFFAKDSDGKWQEQPKLKVRREIGVAYDEARGKDSKIIRDNFDTITLPTL